MPRRNVYLCLSACLCLLLLFANLPADRTIARQSLVEWRAKQRVFIADERTGSVRAFHLGDGAPVLVAQTRSPGRASVRDIKLDAVRQQLWVLGGDAVYVHDAQSLAQLKRLPLDAREANGLRIEDGRLILLASDGEVLGVVDVSASLGLWRAALAARGASAG